jgi:hypothetical protein
VARSASETFRVLGTRGSYRDGLWQTNHRDAPLTARPLETRELSVDEMRDPLPPEVGAAWREADGESIAYGGHGGSHAYLVHEFVDAVAHDRQPAISVYDAVRYMAMGVAAHQSALRDGETLNVPDWGDG